MSTHAKLSPSNSKRWLTCTQSMLLPAEHKEESSSYANRGTALHEMADDILNGKPRKEQYEGYSPTKEDIVLTVEPYVDYVKSLDADLFFYEKKVFITEDCYGTADCIAYNTKTKTVHVVDLKAGKGVFVKVKDNTQLQTYAIGAINFLVGQGYPVPEGIYLHIVQPGINNICSTKIERVELVSLRQKIIKAEKEISEGIGKYHASEEGCRWCPHKTKCVELKRLANKAALNDFEEEEEGLAYKMSIVPVLKLFIKEVEQEALETLLQNKELEGYKLVRGRGKRIFTNEKKMRTALKKAGIPRKEMFHERKPLTVPQIEKLVKKNKVDLDLSLYIESVEGGLKVAESASDTKEVNKTAEAISDFA